MRIPDTVLKAVGYVCEVTHREGDNVFGDPYATGFFVSVPCQAPELQMMEMYYFVTAKHVADGLKDREIYFSVNRKEGGTTRGQEVSRKGTAWSFHPNDKNADVAIIQVGLKPSLVELSPVQIVSFGLPERLRELNIGIGDEVHTVGLFSAVPGNERNTPVARLGMFQ